VKIKDKNQKTNKNQNLPPIKIQYLQSAKIQIFYIITLKKETKHVKYSFIEEKNVFLHKIFIYGRKNYIT
jgi:hypothetical protein